MTDPGLVADVMTHGPEGAKALLRRLGVVEHAEVCEHDWHYSGHDWHYSGTVNGRPGVLVRQPCPVRVKP